jgi:Nitroreductase family
MPKPKELNATHLPRKSSEQFFNVVRSVSLPREFDCPPADLFDILEERESRRKFQAMSIQDISTLLWFAQRQTATIPGTIDRVKSPIPTAGALASVRTVVLRPSEDAWVYDAVEHRAEVLSIPVDTCNRIRISASEFFDIGEGSLLLFFAHRPFIARYYESPDSLVLREAGVLLGTLGLIAEALEFSFCPLGTTAEDWLISLLGGDEQVIIPAGAAVVGRR